MFKGPFTPNINAILQDEWDRQKKEKNMIDNQKKLDLILNKVFDKFDKVVDSVFAEFDDVNEAVNNKDYEPVTNMKKVPTEDEFQKFMKSMKEQSDAAQKEKVPSKIEIDYSSIQTQMEKAAEIIGDSYDTILCITRGGLIPAGMLSYKLGIKDIVSVKIVSYDDDDNLAKSVVEKMSKRDIKKLKKAKRILVVDDIVDSGSTLIALHKYLSSALGLDADELNEKYSTFSIVTKDIDFNDYSIYNLTGDKRWVVFPWDK